MQYAVKVFRLFFLLSLLGLALALWWPNPAISMLPWPIQCDGEKPGWFEDLVEKAKKQGLPGFQLSLSNAEGGRVDCAVGWARLWPWPEPLQTKHTMRYASLSKLMTSVTVIQMFDDSILGPESSLIDALGVNFSLQDERIRDITIADLLRHKAGFDRALSPDPMLQENPWCPSDISKLTSLKLDHQPGQVYAYSNLGYCLLGMIIERKKNKTLAIVFQQNLLSPLRLTMETVHQGEMLIDEPKAVFDEQESLADLLRLNFDAMHATGAWVGNAGTFLGLLNGIISPTSLLLSREGKLALLEVDPACDVSQWRTCHGYGFYRYEEKGKQAMYWRDGSLPGAGSFAAIFEDGKSVVFLTHGRSYDWKPANDLIGLSLYRYMAGQQYNSREK